MNIAIIYHDADFDGKLSRDVCHHFLSQKNPGANITTIGWDYGRETPDVSEFGTVYIVDLSIDGLMSQPALLDKIVWIDHHRTAIEKYQHTFIGGVQIDGVAACRLCWAWFTSTEPLVLEADEFIRHRDDEPLLIYLAGIYDVWAKENADFEAAKNLQFGLRALSEDAYKLLIGEQFNTQSSCILESALDYGWKLRAFCQMQNDQYASQFSHTLVWEGLTFIALNIGQRGNSDLLKGGIDHRHQACFAWRYDGTGVIVSLYHIAGHEHHDLSAIAKRYGGGGHKGACGFRLTLVQLANIFGQ